MIDVIGGQAMATLDDDIKAYLRKCKGHIDRRELFKAFVELGKAGGQVSAAVTVLLGLATAEGIAVGVLGRFGQPSQLAIRRAMLKVWENWAKLDQDQRRAYVTIAAWLRKSQFGF